MATAARVPTPDDFGACLAETPHIVDTAVGPVEYAARGDGPPVLAVHGTLGGWDQGLVGAAFLQLNGYRVLAPSRPGYLGTPLSTGRTFVEQGDALAALLDALEIDRIIAFAASGGGPATYEFAARHPSRLSALVQVDSVCIPGPIPRAISRVAATEAAAKAQLWFLRRFPRQTLGAYLRVAGTYTKAEAKERAADLAARPGSTDMIEATIRTSLDARRRRAGMNNDYHVVTPAALERITCPTLIVHGSRDKIVPPASAEYAHARISGSELHWVDGSHVAFALERADTAPPYVLDWLARAVPPPA